MPPIRRALISVSDKSGILEFAKALADFGIEILSTGGTATLLRDAGVPVMDVSDYTGFPELMDGRVKTLHPKIHGGLLGRRGQDDAVMAEHGILGIDLVVVNLYPFEATIARPDCDLATAIENIDIGGPSMLRAAAKNHAAVTVVVDSANYPVVLDEMKANDGGVGDALRFDLAVQAFEHTAHYDGAIANYLGTLVPGVEDRFPRTYNHQFQKVSGLRYGENPHQQAAFYRDPKTTEACVSTAEQLQGKELSYNNIADADTALECVREYEGTACVIVKHANPCGVALADSPLAAYDRAYQTDPTSAFGGIIAFNCPLDAETAKAIVDRQFVEVIIVPSINDDCREILAAKPNVRVLVTGDGHGGGDARAEFDYKRVRGGLLVQDRDEGRIAAADLKVVSKRQPTAAEINDLLFTWTVAKHVKSNAIVYGRDGQTIGVGAGQMSRVYSARIAAIKAADAGLEVRGSVMASDAFFPFRDGLDSAAEVGVRAVIQPGGSIRDEEVISAADEHDIAMVFTGMRHFRH